MEDKRSTMTNRLGKRRMIFHPLTSLSIGGEGGIAGLIVFGGALAIAGFMAVASFASNKNKAKGTHDHKHKPKQLLLDERGCKAEEDHDTIQHSTIQHQDATCCWASNVCTNKVINSESWILEDKSEVEGKDESPTRFQHQEIVFSDSSHPESAASSNAGGAVKECLVSLFNSPTGQPQEEDQKDEEPQDDITSSEIESETDDDDIKDDDDDDDDVDGDDEDEDDDDDDMMSDDVSEIEEQDCSKATGTTYLDYHEETVWPAEVMQHAKRKLKGDSHVCTDSDAEGSDYDTITVAKHATMNQNLNLLMVPNNQPLTWLFSLFLLALLLLLVLLTHRPQESFYVLEEGNSVVKRI